MNPRGPIDDRLQTIMEAQPGLKPRNNWWKDNWLALAMFGTWVLGQSLGAGGWVQQRDNREANLTAQVEDLRAQLVDVRAKYVRQDVFEQVLRRIDDHLANIEDKVSPRAR